MIEVRFLRAPLAGTDVRSLLCGFVVEGHAGFDEYGKDIICAGVSAVTQAAVLGLRDLAGDPAEYEKRSGYLAVRVRPAVAAQPGPQAILRTVELAVTSISQEHPTRVRVVKD